MSDKAYERGFRHTLKTPHAFWSISYYLPSTGDRILESNLFNEI